MIDIVTYMNNILTYKEFIGSVQFSPEDKTFFGKIEGISDLVTFEADNVTDLIKEFKSAVNDYLVLCPNKKTSPLKSAKGSFNVKTSPEAHWIAMNLAKQKGYKSLNQYVSEAIDEKNSRELFIKNYGIEPCFQPMTGLSISKHKIISGKKKLIKSSDKKYLSTKKSKLSTPKKT